MDEHVVVAQVKELAGITVQPAENRVEQGQIVFDETKFSVAGENGDFSADDRADIVRIRAAYPQLTTWGDFAIFEAWGDYSQNVYLLKWL